ncbi:DUF4442 domain-containing protein [Veronia nyctiphanis]|uniref:DUF4442 domain-containing protein n=1 Tax=Veronia nyctiphanis TaxID=1278244 RepID=A0A4Q0YWL5_9GAMM|nr:DUF4442 domain-containing protein [Veronia nyctiphanis]RXJ74664.1 DUF4442 domain-containing protein [Veronia nyctiphanis]
MWLENLKLKIFSLAKIPMISYCKSKLIYIDEQKVQIMLPLTRRTKNHHNSMYMGALAVGADIAGGYLAYYKTRKENKKVSLAFKSMKGEFLKRPEADVVFTCDQGDVIDNMLEETFRTGQRINKDVEIVATCPTLHGDEPMAVIHLTLSLKAIKK